MRYDPSEPAASEYFDYNRNHFQKEIGPGETNVYLFYFQDGIPMIKGFQMKSEVIEHHLTNTFEDRPVIPIPRGSAGGFGESDAGYVIHPNPLDVVMHPVDVLNAYLNKQSDITKATVGPPFTIFQLSSSGGQWVQSGDMCKNYSDLK